MTDDGPEIEERLQRFDNVRDAIGVEKEITFTVQAKARELEDAFDRFTAIANRDGVQVVERGTHSAVLSVVLGPYDEREGPPPNKRASFGRWRTIDLRVEWKPTAAGSTISAQFDTAAASRPSRLAFITNAVLVMIGAVGVLLALVNSGPIAWMLFVAALAVGANPAYQLSAVLSYAADRRTLTDAMLDALAPLQVDSDPYRRLPAPDRN